MKNRAKMRSGKAKMRSGKMLAATAFLTIVGAVAVCAATNVNPPLAGPEQTVKEARVFENYSLTDMKRVFFDSGRSEISADDRAALSRMLKQIRANNQSVIELRAYADGAESAEQGNAISSLRAQALALYFADRGVEPGRIRIISFQEIENVGAAANPERRRVDVRVFVPPPGEHH